MRKAISTKYLGPTNTRGSRIKAFAGGNLSLTIPLDYALSIEARHAKVAMALAEKLNWPAVYIGGGTEKGFVFVALEGSFSRAWAEKYLCGQEGADWFLVEDKRP